MKATELRNALRDLRLERGWSYDQLAADINATLGGVKVSPATVRRAILNKRNYDTTRHSLQRYLERQSSPPEAATS
jgi:transcriptional regulator with XRE-family HTH domain